MRRFAPILIGALVATLLLTTAARAAAPTLSAPEATNVQGVSALLKGAVDPQGLATTYRYEYSTSPAFSGSSLTSLRTVGSGSNARPARAAIAGLQPSTTYFFRLRASNADGATVGSTESFATTEGFGFLPGTDGFAARVIADGGETATVAGSHPYQLDFDIELNQGGEFEGQLSSPFPDGDIRDLRIEMPSGLIVNPSVVPGCSREQFNTPRSSPFAESRSGESCPDNTQVGTALVKTSAGERTFGLFKLRAAPGVAAQFGFAPFGAPVVLNVRLSPNPDGSYSLSLGAKDIPQAIDLYGLDLALWGTPWAASHNGERGDCLNETEPTFPWAKCSVGNPATFAPLSLLSLPPLCSGQLSFTATARAWQQPAEVSATGLNRTTGGAPAQMTCGFSQFAPKVVGHLDNTQASSGSGFVFRLDVNHQNLVRPDVLNPTPPRTAVVELPDGTSLNPSVGAGLGVCTPAQFAGETVFSPEGAACPNAAKIGTLTAKTPLFSDTLSGAVYLAEPDDPSTSTPGAENPFDSLLAVYMLAKSPDRGVMIKLAGELTPDPADGTLTAIFDGLPQLPYTNLEIKFRSGQRAFLITPPRCGYVGTQIEMAPLGNEANVDVTSYTLIKTGIGGGSCPSGTPPFSPDVVAGGVNSNVGSYTPYFVRLSRKDTEQEITSYSLVLPKGITGRLAGIPFCPETAIAAARTRSGFDEIADPSCPSASQVGQTNTGYGVGSALTYAPGRIYLAGPYKGAPLSLVTINAATVGPFDLGTIVIRSAFQVDPETAQLQLDPGASDPIPHIIDGVPLHLREVRIHVDRFQFTRNPTSCRASELISTLTGSGARFDDASDDSTATIRNHFQLLNCLDLGFEPKLGIRLIGRVRRGANPALRTVLRARPGDASMAGITVTMPKSLFLAQNHIRGICTRPQFAADNCPRDSIYGRAAVYTDLFDEPLSGPVLLRSSNNRLPDLVASLHSGAVRIVLRGRIGPSKRGGIRAFFANVPDAPINAFVMQLNGGRRGLLANSVNICRHPPKATVKALGQNNRGTVFTATLRGQCRKFIQRQKRRRQRAKRRGSGRASVSVLRARKVRR